MMLLIWSWRCGSAFRSHPRMAICAMPPSASASACSGPPDEKFVRGSPAEGVTCVPRRYRCQCPAFRRPTLPCPRSPVAGEGASVGAAECIFIGSHAILPRAMEDEMAERVRTWQLKDARANFSTLVDKAISDGPQIVTRNGKKAVVVMSIEEWTRRERHPGDLVDFFANSPLREEAIDIERQRDYPREIEF